MARLGRRGVVALERELTARDRAIVGSVADFRFLTAGQIERLHFTSSGVMTGATARTSRRVLERLADRQVLDRLERRIGGVRAGSAGFIYRLGPVGRRLLEGEGRQPRGRQPSSTFLHHALAVAEVYIATRVEAGVRQWQVISFEPEPRCWRVVAGVGGSEQLRPDLHLAMADGETEWHWFVEIDLGTEHLPTIRRKCRQYQAYYQSGVEQDRRGVFPRVAWLTTELGRAQQISRAISTDPGLQAGLFIVGTIDDAAKVLLPEGEQ